MAVNLGALQNIRPLPDPIARAHNLGALRAQQQEEVTRGQEQQLNALNIEGKAAANQEWAKVRSIFDKHSGDKEGAISEILQTPWRSKEITDTYQSEADRMRKDAISNAQLKQGQPAPEIAAAAPQTTTMPIQASLTDPAQMSTPEVSPAGIQAVPLPVQPTKIPFGGPAVQTQTAQQLLKAKREELQAESDIKTQQAITEARAKVAAEHAGKADVKLDENYRNGHKFLRMQRADGSQYEVDAGVSEAAPQNSQPAMSENRFNQELSLAKQRAVLAAANRVDPTRVVNYSEGGVNKIGVLNKKTNQIEELKTPAGQTASAKLAEVPAALKTQATAALTALRQVDNIDKIVAANPQLVGPIVGRFEQFMQGVGSNPFVGTKDERLGAQLAEHLNALFAQELRSMFPGRTNEQMQDLIKSTSAQLKQNPNMLMGMLEGIKTNEGMVLDTAKAQGFEPDRMAPTAPAATAPSGIEVNPKTGQYRRKSGSGFEYSDDKGSTWHK